MIRYILLILFFSIILSGCVGGLLKSGGGQKVKGLEFAKGGIVEDFPLVPGYKNAKVSESFGSSGKFGASMFSGDDLSKVVEFYNEALPAAGWQTVLRKISESNFVFDIKNDSQKGTVTVNRADNGQDTAIKITVSER